MTDEKGGVNVPKGVFGQDPKTQDAQPKANPAQGNPAQGATAAGNGGGGAGGKPKPDPEQQAEEKVLNELEENMLEMRSAMFSMMSSATKTMQAFVDMRVNYLKMMREGMDDPATMMNIVSKNMTDTATALRKERAAAKKKE